MTSSENARVSIITAAFNSEKTIEDTIKSVLSQTLAPYEYIVIDGNSTDRTVEICNSYKSEFESKGINFIVVSEPDKGIYDAMNKGIRLAKGDIIGIINSDDWYETEAVSTVAEVYKDKGFDMFYADLCLHHPGGATIIKRARNRKYATSRDWNHPTTFITSKMYEKYQYSNETIHDDYDLILRMKKNNVHIEIVNRVLAHFRMNGVSHERSVKKAYMRFKVKYGIYRKNGYPFYYAIEPLIQEVGKLIIG